MLTFEEQAARFRHYNESMVRSHILDLYCSDREVQVRAANQLCDYSYSPLVVRHLIEQLNSEQSDVRLYATLVLTRLAPFSLALLVSALQNEDRSLIRCGIIKVLGNIGSLYATTFVVSALNDTDARVRQAAAYALMIIEDEETTPILCQSLRSSDNYIRCCAAITLGNINTEIVKSALDEARQDSDKQVREYIEEALLNHKKIDEERLESFKIWCVGERNRRRIEQDRLRQKDQDSRQKVEHDLSQKTNDRPTVPDKPAPQTSQDKAVHADSVVKQPASYQPGINAATQQAALHEDTIHEAELPKAETDEYLELAYRDWDELWDYRVGIMLENLLERRGNILLAIEMVGGHPRAKRSLLDLLEGDDDILREAAADALLSSGVAEAAVERRLQRYEQRNNPSDPGSYKFKPSPEESPAAASAKQTPARSGYAIPTPPPLPAPKVFALDMDSVRQKIAETAQVQELLQAQFVEDEGTSAVVAVTPAPADTSEEASETNPFKNLDTPHFALLNMLMKKPIWKRQDVEAVAKPLGLMTSGALERLNEMALEMGEDNIFEGDDPIYVDIALARGLLL